MKMKITFLILGIFFSATVPAQNESSANSHSIQLAHRIAKKMKDTLALSAQQRQQVYQVNITLSDQKHALRQQDLIANSLRVQIQRVERTRDSLYLPILGNEKYQLYLEKKRNLINNN